MTGQERGAPAIRSTTSVTTGAPRASGAFGWAFVVLLLISAGMASVPGGDDPTAEVRDFYVRHSGVVFTAQLVGLLAAATFVPFVLTVRPRAVRVRFGALEASGLAIAGAAVITAVPVLWLTAVSDDGTAGLVHRLAVLSDLTDVLLFATIALWAALLFGAAEPVWLKALAGLLAALALARTVLLVLGSGLLELLAPLAFVLVVAVLSTLALVRRSPLIRP